MKKIKQFEDEIMAIALKRFKRHYDSPITNKNGIYYDKNGIELIEWKKDSVKIIGYKGIELVPYKDDFLTFIKNIEKVAKNEDCRELKNLTQLKNLILIQDFNEKRKKFTKEEEFIKKLKKVVYKFYRSISDVIEYLDIKTIDQYPPKEGQTIYGFEMHERKLNSVVKLRISKTKFQSDEPDYIDEDDYSFNNVFIDKEDAELAYLIYMSWYLIDVIEDEYKTKKEKVEYIKSMESFKEWFTTFSSLFNILDNNFKLKEI